MRKMEEQSGKNKQARMRPLVTRDERERGGENDA